MMREHKKDRVLVIGIDGATFRVIDRLINEGRLPHLRRLMDHGCRANLISTQPPLSPVAWTSIITGVNPGKHGIFDFVYSQAKDYRLEPLNGSARRVPPIWSYLDNLGYCVGAINVPYSYPPEAVNGIVISGMDTPPMAKDFVHPPEMKRELEHHIRNYFIHVPLRRDRDNLNVKENLSVIKEAVESRTKTVTYVMDHIDWDFLMAVYIVTDRVQHDFWDQREKGDPGEKIIIDETYELIDESIGKILEKIDDRTTIILVSDHGFEGLNGHISLRKWLSLNGYLREHDTGPKQERWFSTAHLKVNSFLRQNLKFLQKVPGVMRVLNRAMGSKISQILYDPSSIDWPRTRAFCLGTCGNIFINVKGRNPAGSVAQSREYDELRQEIKGKLLAMTVPETGEKVVKRVYFKEEIFSGPVEDEAPDIVVHWMSGYHGTGLKDRHVVKGADRQEDFFSRNTWWKGIHDPEGIFIAAGPNFKNGKIIDPISVLDVVPTILYLMNTSLPQYLDGRVPTALFSESFLSGRPITVLDESTSPDKESLGRAYDEKEKAAIEKRLKDLGYL
jgi:predicted AlkP superfamily phosphohydrolase/phosphomutase